MRHLIPVLALLGLTATAALASPGEQRPEHGPGGDVDHLCFGQS